MIKSEKQAAAALNNEDNAWSEKLTAAAANDDVDDASSWKTAAARNNEKSDNISAGAVANNNDNSSYEEQDQLINLYRKIVLRIVNAKCWIRKEKTKKLKD